MRLVFAAVALLFSVSSASALQVAPTPPKATVIDFEPDVVDGTPQDPDLEDVIVRLPERLRSLVQVREDFDRELINSAESL